MSKYLERLEGYSSLPCCGVYAVALVTDKPFDVAWNEIAKTQKRPNAWKGRTGHTQRAQAIGWLGKTLKRVQCPRNITLRNFVDQYTRRDGVYIVTLGSHIVAVKNNEVCDKYEHNYFDDHGSRLKRVRHAYEVI
jgi:hypothetical protein